MTDDVIIIGGGLAGLSAAAALAQRSLRVRVLESRPRFGGRASSFLDRDSGVTIDNCQHVSMGCCTNFEHFCNTLGISGLLKTQSTLNFIGPEGTVSRFSAGRWPAPLHLLSAFRGLDFFSRSERRQIQSGLRALCREQGTASHDSFAQWLRAHHQNERVVNRFWHVVLVSALSESLERISLSAGRKVFVDGFLANRRGWQVRIPVVPLNELYGQTLHRWFEQHNAVLQLKAGVHRLMIENGRVRAVELRNGERVAGDHFVLAVPHHRVRSLLPDGLRDDPVFAGIDELETAPISSVHLWFDRAITDLPHAVFVDRLSQWMFNRTGLQCHKGRPLWRPGGTPAPASDRHKPAGVSPEADTSGSPEAHPAEHYYQIVISASRELAGRSREEVVAQVLDELSSCWPETASARLLHSRLITEHRAVFSPLPGVGRLRPVQQTPIANLQLAGDWTATGWPATMESAVRSGYLAAENVLRQLGRFERLLQPDLRVGFLSRLLLGL